MTATDKKILLPHQFYYPHVDMKEDRANSEKRTKLIDSLQKNSSKEAMIYIHVPYCNSQCSFCGFNKTDNVSHSEEYVDALKHEIDFYANTPYVKSLEVTGIHIGGGTPTYLSGELLGQIIDYAQDKFNAQNVPLNIEGSSTTLDDETIRMLKSKNVSRVSLGVQSFNDDLRQRLNMKASLDDVLQTISRLKEQGIVTYIDIMHGFPDFGIENQNEIAKSDAQKAIYLGVDGLDFSQFYPFHNSLEKIISEGNLAFPTSKEVVNTITDVTKLLESAGYVQTTEYGFCKKGEIMLEKAYFGKDEGVDDCLALGPSSIGMLNGFRYRNSLYPTYCDKESPALLQVKELSQDEIERMAVMGFPKVLRIAKHQLTGRLMPEYQEKFEQLKEKGWLTENEDYFELTPEGKRYINNIQLSLLSEGEKSKIEGQLKILVLE